MSWTTTFAESIRSVGWGVTESVVPVTVIDSLIASVDQVPNDQLRGGMRNLLDLPWVCDLARSTVMREAAESVLGEECFAVRGLFFDKSVDANWRVPWHQDLTIAVKEELPVEGFGPWSVKAGVPHVQAPAQLLSRMLAVRLHLDDCGPSNGPLRLLPGSHQNGILSAHEIDDWVGQAKVAIGLANAGAILGFRPLMLHASSSAVEPRHRRVVHLEFAAFPLPGGLRWQWQV